MSIFSPISKELNKLNESVDVDVGIDDDGVKEGDSDGDWDVVDGDTSSSIILSSMSRVLNALTQLDTSTVTLVGAEVGRMELIKESVVSSNNDCVVAAVLSLSGALSFGRSNCTVVESVTPSLFSLPEVVVIVADSLVESEIPPFASERDRALFRLPMVVPTAYPTDAIRTATAMTPTAMMHSVLFRLRRRLRCCGGIIGNDGEDSE